MERRLQSRGKQRCPSPGASSAVIASLFSYNMKRNESNNLLNFFQPEIWVYEKFYGDIVF